MRRLVWAIFGPVLALAVLGILGGMVLAEWWSDHLTGPVDAGRMEQ